MPDSVVCRDSTLQQYTPRHSQQQQQAGQDHIQASTHTYCWRCLAHATAIGCARRAQPSSGWAGGHPHGSQPCAPHCALSKALPLLNLCSLHMCRGSSGQRRAMPCVGARAKGVAADCARHNTAQNNAMPSVMLMLPEERHTFNNHQDALGAKTSCSSGCQLQAHKHHPHLAPNKDPAPNPSSLPFPCAGRNIEGCT